MDQKPIDAVKDVQEMDLPELFSRYTIGGLERGELEILAEKMWQVDEKDRRFMQGVLSEPPKPSAIFAPRELSRILQKLVSSYTSQDDISEKRLTLVEVWRLRLEICLCLDGTVTPRFRLSRALNQFSELPAGQRSPIASTNRMWIAEIAYRLADGFGNDMTAPEIEAVARLGRIAVLAQAPFCRSSTEFHALLRQFCELTFRLDVPDRQALARDDWERNLSESIDRFRLRQNHDGDDQLEAAPAEAMEHAVKISLDLVRAAMLQRRDTLVAWATSLAESESPTFALRSDQKHLKELFVTLVAIGRAQATQGQPASQGLRATLCVLRAQDIRAQAEIAHLQAQDPLQGLEHLHELLKLSEIDSPSPEDKERRNALRAKIDSDRPPYVKIDDKILTSAIDEVLEPRGTGRRGLALSGGGFRAACFHLGVLACLADRDMLRKVNVLSCVSGGAIAGAAYAVRLKALLATKHDLEITASDYREVVSDLVNNFTHLMGMNLRAAAFRNPISIFRMWLRPNYTFTERIADMLDAHLFAPLIKSHPNFKQLDSDVLATLARSGEGHTRPTSIFRQMLGSKKVGWPLAPWDLRDSPYCESTDFDLDSKHNDVRRAKCPELFINTTSLNTGGPFLFSTNANGEPVNELRQKISSRPTFLWRSYSDFNTGGDINPASYRLSRIVAASASVPGLLPPMLFQRTNQAAVLALADGGICDNQGFSPLISSACNWILASDAAGQLRFESYPEVANFEVMMHSTEILMERIREMSYVTANNVSSDGSGIEFLTLHLTRGLTDPLPNATFDLDESLASIRGQFHNEKGDTGFGVSSMCQRLLANMRTDLDCFSESEVMSLMAGGYLQAAHVLGSSAVEKEKFEESWKFMEIAPHLANLDSSSRLAQVLNVAQFRFMRLPRLIFTILSHSLLGRGTLLLSGMLGAPVLLYISYLAWLQPVDHSLTNRGLQVVAGYSIALFIIHRLPPTGTKRWLWKLSSAPFLILAMIHAWTVIFITDPIYRRLCRFTGQASQINTHKE